MYSSFELDKEIVQRTISSIKNSIIMLLDLLPLSCSLYQSKNFVKFSYHALEACFNPDLSLVFLPISILVAEVVGIEDSISLF